MSVSPSPPPPVRSEPSCREMDAFCLRYAPRAPGHAAVRDLCRLLYVIPSEDREARDAWVERCIAWLREPRSASGLHEEEEPQPLAASRLKLLVRVLEGERATRLALSRLVGAICAEAHGLKLFAQVGLADHPGFLSELTDRVLQRLLPAPPDPERLSDLLLLFPKPEDVTWLESLPAGSLARLLAMVGEPPPPLPDPGMVFRAHLVDALALLATRTAALGLDEEVRDRSPGMAFRASPFLRLRRTCDGVLARNAAPDTLRELETAVADCRSVTDTVTQHLEQSGLSVKLVYRLDSIRGGLDRMESIARVLGASPGEARCREGLALILHLLRTAHEERSVRELAKTHLRLMARTTIERVGHSAEHPLISTRAEFHSMVHSASGGGLLAAITAALCLFLDKLAMAPFFTGLLSTFNYAGSFVLMQFLGFTLAARQPSMTAAMLAGAMGGKGPRPGRLERLEELIPCLTRSQLAALLGNLSCVLLASVGLTLLSHHATGQPLLAPDQAQAVIDSLHPWRSATLAWAALTGVLLWVASLASGWMENFFVYRRLPEALAHHRGLQRLLGDTGAHGLAGFMLRHVAGIGGGITLGVLLAVVPKVGSFFGLPLEVRHVTLSLGSLALAGGALGAQAVLTWGFLAALLGILGIAALNIGVSFALALTVALRARDISSQESWRLLRWVGLRLMKEPRSFLLPPPVPPAPAASGQPVSAPAQTEG
ncbi:site-specific recombinase [Stigmatella aurantiaca]|uniref:Adventurous gliding motility protein n=1 Tax=Stigmatella aurantiaca (strain DW4/3-1) TaxID=378806 RepID=Q09A90_STIAD|nr:site-specific recombinase [Stigmatella aurantiaca]ADO75059.1 Adventurous gliding motility protein [Stigmatella aurantiaca DW4/3-1]EAU68647.1 adventurous gliding motility protein G [Stigmatella aurantiaca DW4/3-1]